MKDYLKLNKLNNALENNNVPNIIIEDIKKRTNSKKGNEIIAEASNIENKGHFEKKENNKNLFKNDFTGIIFETINEAPWSESISDIFQNKENPRTLKNKQNSFILIHCIKDKNGELYIFAVAGGLERHQISYLIEKNFGLNLIPKTIKEGTNIIKKVDERKFYGNVLSNQRRNINMTNVHVERDFVGLFTELSIVSWKLYCCAVYVSAFQFDNFSSVSF